MNGTLVPARPVPGPHSLHPDGRHYFQNGTAVPHHGRAHGPGAAAAGPGGGQGAQGPHWHSPPQVAASVRVSDVALRNGMLIEGITDGIAGLPAERQREILRARGAPDGLDVGAMEVRRLHEVTLVAELPVGVPDAGGYAGIGPDLAVEPWGCWPRLYHPASCLEVRSDRGGRQVELRSVGYHPTSCLEGLSDRCPAGRSGAAWVP